MSAANTITVLITTLEEGLFKVPKIIRPEKAGVDYLVIHQLGSNPRTDIYKGFIENNLNRPDVRVTNIEGRNLSRSRNYGINSAKGHYCLICDDDVRLVDDFAMILRHAFEKESKSSVITFEMTSPDGEPFIKYQPKSFKHNLASILNVSSGEVVVRRKDVFEKNVFFDENFGAGSELPFGETIVFLKDCMAKGLDVSFFPAPLVYHAGRDLRDHLGPQKIEALGAVMRKLFGSRYWIQNFTYAIKNYPEVRPYVSFPAYLSGLFKGSRRVKK